MPSLPPVNREAETLEEGSFERRVFWAVIAVLGLVVVALLPLWWAVAATVPVVLLAWWLAYESRWVRRRFKPEASASSETGDKHAA